MEEERQRNHKEMERLANMGELMTSEEEEVALNNFDKPPDMVPEGSEDEGIRRCASEIPLGGLPLSNNNTRSIHL